jgi:hypothetical protein
MSQDCALWMPRIMTIENLAKRIEYTQGSLLTKLTDVARLTSDSMNGSSRYQSMNVLRVIEL